MANKVDEMLVAVAGVSAAVIVIIMLLGEVPWITATFELSAAQPRPELPAAPLAEAGQASSAIPQLPSARRSGVHPLDAKERTT